MISMFQILLLTLIVFSNQETVRCIGTNSSGPYTNATATATATRCWWWLGTLRWGTTDSIFVLFKPPSDSNSSQNEGFGDEPALPVQEEEEPRYIAASSFSSNAEIVTYSDSDNDDSDFEDDDVEPDFDPFNMSSAALALMAKDEKFKKKVHRTIRRATIKAARAQEQMEAEQKAAQPIVPVSKPPEGRPVASTTAPPSRPAPSSKPSPSSKPPPFASSSSFNKPLSSPQPSTQPRPTPVASTPLPSTKQPPTKQPPSSTPPSKQPPSGTPSPSKQPPSGVSSPSKQSPSGAPSPSKQPPARPKLQNASANLPTKPAAKGPGNGVVSSFPSSAVTDHQTARGARGPYKYQASEQAEFADSDEE